MKQFQDLRIVFIGTPDFAVASLHALVVAGANIVGVVTAPDKPAGRGMHLQAPPVKVYAQQHSIPVLQPEKLKNPDFLAQLKALNADIQVVVAFRMLPEAVWNMPPMGTINVHGSLLPQYRGAAPINWTIINGEQETGVTTFKLKHEIDTGDILLQQAVPILPTDDAGTLHDKLMLEGAALLVTTIKGLAAGTLQELPQNKVETAQLIHAPKIFKHHLLLDFTTPAHDLELRIRGFSPYPAAFTLLEGKQLKIFRAHVHIEPMRAEPGKSESDGNSFLRFAAADGWLYADEVQLEGKKRMDIAAFLRGYRFATPG